MLIEFAVQNFRSIKKEQALSLVADDIKGDHMDSCVIIDPDRNLSVLKSAAIYGPNASGKTNILNALLSLRSLVLFSGQNQLDQKISQYSPHLLDVDFENSPIQFGLEFLAKDINNTSSKVRYLFLVEFNDSRILREELSMYKSAKPSTLYKRVFSEPVKWGDSLKGKKQGIESTLLDNQLFISVAGNTKDHPLNLIYRHFRDSILPFRASSFHDPVSSGEYTRKSMIGDNSDFYIEKISELLKAADTGINKIRIKQTEIGEMPEDFNKLGLPSEVVEEIKKTLSQRPCTEHSKYSDNTLAGIEDFDIEEESEGTRQLFRLAGPIIEALKGGATLVVDELNSSLHPSISRYIIELFQDKKLNPNNAQILFTTHDVLTLNSDLLRRDQVWFTEKDKYGATQLFSLLEFGKNTVRKGTDFGSWYLKGKFGALPFIDKNMFTILESQQPSDDDG